jgi:nucleoid-associated protein YgaU
MSITEWRGGKPYKMSLPILLDGHARGTVIEPQIALLEHMGRAEGGNDEPPILSIEFPASRPRTPGVDWVLNDIAWGDAIYVNGLRTRQAATLEFIQHGDEESIITLSPARRRKRKKSKAKKGKGKKGARQKTYQVKKGDTLMKIAARFLGSASRWQEIAKLNKIRDPRNLKVGRTLRLP